MFQSANVPLGAVDGHLTNYVGEDCADATEDTAMASRAAAVFTNGDGCEFACMNTLPGVWSAPVPKARGIGGDDGVPRWRACRKRATLASDRYARTSVASDSRFIRFDLPRTRDNMRADRRRGTRRC
jgi:hypothetical protein